MKALLDARIADEKTDRFVRSIAEAVRELQALPVVATQIINDVVLPSDVVVLVPHKLGRRPRITLHSAPRGATLIGLISEVVDIAAGNPDRSRYVALKASGMGATVTVDVEVK